VEVDLLHALDLAGLDQATELGDGLPLFFFISVSASAATTASTTSTAALTTTVTARSETSSTGSARATISHIDLVGYVVEDFLS
jgi:hypothetical protein